LIIVVGYITRCFTLIKVRDEGEETSAEDIFVIAPPERNLIAPSKTNIDIFIPEKRNNALPKIDNFTGNENSSAERKQKKEKNRKKKTKEHPNDSN
jgi:hypothetical protein